MKKLVAFHTLYGLLLSHEWHALQRATTLRKRMRLQLLQTSVN